MNQRQPEPYLKVKTSTDETLIALFWIRNFAITQLVFFLVYRHTLSEVYVEENLKNLDWNLTQSDPKFKVCLSAYSASFLKNSFLISQLFAFLQMWLLFWIFLNTLLKDVLNASCVKCQHYGFCSLHETTPTPRAQQSIFWLSHLVQSIIFNICFSFIE